MLKVSIIIRGLLINLMIFPNFTKNILVINKLKINKTTHLQPRYKHLIVTLR